MNNRWICSQKDDHGLEWPVTYLTSRRLLLLDCRLAQINLEDYRNAKVVVKGCGNLPVPIFAYVEISRMLTSVTQSIMYGEPCSTVPIYKKIKK